MGLFSGFVFFLVLFLLQGSNTSFVQVSDNGYENVIIAIHPDVPEDETLIGKIKDMVTEASAYLFEATEKRLFFKNVSILVPEKWKKSPDYKRPKRESYAHADIKVALPTVPGGDEPYTRQFTECGEKAEFIHLTPDFVLGKKQREFGPSGRLLVHEWAHLRWGVFDEYNEEEPFYAAKSKKIEATRCSTGITGANRVLQCQGGSCAVKLCKVDSKTKLYEKDCQFFPDQYQTETASIMFMQAIDSVVEFCNEKKHNREAPTLQNKKCNSKSTWEVIRISEDFNSTKPMTAPPPSPVFSLLRISKRIVCLVLDTSGSMGASNRLNRMNQAARHFLLEIIENGSFVGMVRFDSSASVLSDIIQITSKKERDTLVGLLPKEAKGGTDICRGINEGFQVIIRKVFQLDGSEILLLTDGEDSSAGSCVPTVEGSGAIVHFIALGPSADKGVTQMSTLTGGKHILVSDIAQNNGLIDAFSALTSANADVSQQPIQLESKGLKLSNNDWMNDTVIIDSTVGKDTSFLVTWQHVLPVISLWDSSGKPMENFIVDEGSKMAYLHIPETAMVGTWNYNLEAKANSEILTITVNSRAANPSVPPITVSAKMNKDANSYPNPMIVYAEVLQGYTPVLGANVTAFVESNNGKTEILQLLDNGAGADAFKNDGVYSRYFTGYSENGRYNLKVRVHDGPSAKRSFRHPPNRAAFIPGWVVNGEIEANPPQPEIENDTQTTLGSFNRIAIGDAFVITNVPQNPSLIDPFPPNQITDLEATGNEDEISLMWTAPGDDFDVGTVKQYIIRISGNILDLQDNFDNALQVNTTDLLPKEANSKETFTFKQGSLTGENVTHIFIAIKSVDKSNLTSKVSNIAQVPLFIPKAEVGPDGSNPSPGPDGSHPNSGLSISSLVLIVVGSVAAVCIIISTTICVLTKKRNSSRPSTGF